MSNFVKSCRASFVEKFGEGELYCGVAPGRVNLIGEHTDYNEGFVFPMCMPMYTVCIGKKNSSNQVNVYSKTLQKEANFSGIVENLEKTADKDQYWTNFVRGSIRFFLDNSEAKLPGFDLLIGTEVPLGGGLSSSASLGVAVITFCEAISKTKLSTQQKALGAKWAENVFADSPCGMMDQWISAHGEEGHAMLLDCRDKSHKMFPVYNENLVFLVVNSNVKHALQDSPYAERQNSCFTAAKIMGCKSLREATLEMLKEFNNELNELQTKRARHAISEDVRTQAATVALQNGEFEKFGQLMNESHNSLRDDFEVSCAELDELVNIARSCDGVLGSRMTGGGFGGCTVTLVKKNCVENLQQVIEEKYSGKASFYVATAADGAKIIDV